MTLEELKTEAEKQGYRLIKKPEPLPKIKPCPCGRKRLELWHRNMWSAGYLQIGCPKCKRRGDWGKNEREARELWNMRITDEGGAKMEDGVCESLN